MKQLINFVLKVTTLSLVLFVLWHPISRLYGGALDLTLWGLYPEYNALEKNEIFPYLSSLGLIPLISLLIFTTKIKWMKKLVTILSCGVLMILLDALYIMFASETNPGLQYILYRSLKWVIPFLGYLIVAREAISERLLSQELKGA